MEWPGKWSKAHADCFRGDGGGENLMGKRAVSAPDARLRFAGSGPGRVETSRGKIGMRLAQLLEAASWAEAEACFRRECCGERTPEDLSDAGYVGLHEHVHGRLLMLDPEPSDVVIDITQVEDEDGAGAVSVSGIAPGTKERLGLCLTRWEEWLGMEVAPSALDRFPAPEIIAHCLYEMSFHGYEQDEIARFREDLERMAVAARRGTLDTKEVVLDEWMPAPDDDGADAGDGRKPDGRT